MDNDYEETLIEHYVSRKVRPMIHMNDIPTQGWPTNPEERHKVRSEAALKNNCIYLPYWGFINSDRTEEDTHKLFNAAYKVKLDNITAEYLTSFSLGGTVDKNFRVPILASPVYELTDLQMPEGWGNPEAVRGVGFAEDVCKSILDQISKFIHTCSSKRHLYIKLKDVNKGVKIEWMVMGDPYLVRYANLSGKDNLLGAKVHFKSSTNLYLRGKLYVFPIIHDDEGNHVTLFRIESDERVPFRGRSLSSGEYYGVEGHFRVVTTIPVLACFYTNPHHDTVVQQPKKESLNENR